MAEDTNTPTAGDPRARRRGQGELEAQVLAVLQQAPGPATAGWVQERLDGDLAYTTVMTILSRLHAKSAVSRTRSGRSYLWQAASDAAGLAALRMRRVLDGEADRDAVLASFVTALLPHDEELLRTLLDSASAPDLPTTGPAAPGPSATDRES
ncbi:BlaI/MecI/CopY family transcriptional regulator [Streptomyces sp. BE303]|uniref:BlaI/MecI/CopY family transcriptional regulator n=1 Tax=Streptomycetaceae TaxID=2062 RepID=UPI002E767F8D|nr:BlaI/MecI/CopY family transcriptional regulator [Streptomyces sp. BE303]MED7951675.1 BlaI/MecI/CopY family transcriptional regulator [Streptomyces sp. BE303]